MVEEIVSGSEVIYSALSEGVLNLSAYAEKIQSEVAERTRKPVKKGSIVAALARMQKKSGLHDMSTNVRIENLTIKSPLTEIVYNRSSETLAFLKNFYALRSVDSSEYFTVTQGTNEISIICSEKTQAQVKKIFATKQKVLVTGLVALSVRFSDEYITQPNVIFSLLRRIAIKKVVIAELVSTYTELTFIIKQEDVGKVLESFSPEISS